MDTRLTGTPCSAAAKSEKGDSMNYSDANPKYKDLDWISQHIEALRRDMALARQLGRKRDVQCIKADIIAWTQRLEQAVKA